MSIFQMKHSHTYPRGWEERSAQGHSISKWQSRTSNVDLPHTEPGPGATAPGTIKYTAWQTPSDKRLYHQKRFRRSLSESSPGAYALCSPQRAHTHTKTEAFTSAFLTNGLTPFELLHSGFIIFHSQITGEFPAHLHKRSRKCSGKGKVICMYEEHWGRGRDCNMLEFSNAIVCTCCGRETRWSTLSEGDGILWLSLS